MARTTYQSHRHEIVASRYHGAKLAEALRVAGAEEIFTATSPKTEGNLRASHSEISMVPVSRHVVGTARMGRDPATSVCDPWGRLWEAPNVLIADSVTVPDRFGLWADTHAGGSRVAQRPGADRQAGSAELVGVTARPRLSEGLAPSGAQTSSNTLRMAVDQQRSLGKAVGSRCADPRRGEEASPGTADLPTSICSPPGRSPSPEPAELLLPEQALASLPTGKRALRPWG